MKRGADFSVRLFSSGLLFLLSGTFIFGEEPQGPQKKTENDSGKEVVKNLGINIVDKDGMLFIDGIIARDISLKTKNLDIALSNFEYMKWDIKWENLQPKLNYDGVVFFIQLKNKAKKNMSIRLVQSPGGNEHGIITAAEAPGRPLLSSFPHPWFASGKYPYSTVGLIESMGPEGVAKSDLVFFPLTSDAKKVEFKVSIPLEREGAEFYVLLKDLVKVTPDARRSAYDKFKK